MRAVLVSLYWIMCVTFAATAVKAKSGARQLAVTAGSANFLIGLSFLIATAELRFSVGSFVVFYVACLVTMAAYLNFAWITLQPQASFAKRDLVRTKRLIVYLELAAAVYYLAPLIACSYFTYEADYGTYAGIDSRMYPDSFRFGMLLAVQLWNVCVAITCIVYYKVLSVGCDEILQLIKSSSSPPAQGTRSPKSERMGSSDSLESGRSARQQNPLDEFATKLRASVRLTRHAAVHLTVNMLLTVVVSLIMSGFPIGVYFVSVVSTLPLFMFYAMLRMLLRRQMATRAGDTKPSLSGSVSGEAMTTSAGLGGASVVLPEPAGEPQSSA